jgi:glycosyltransferase involved in cell wall biosynthesis
MSIDRPLRFCHITTFYPPYSFGGDAIFVQALSNELVRRGHHVEVVHCMDSYRLLAEGDETRASYNDHPNLIVHGLSSPWGPFSPLATQQTGFPFLKTRQIQAILSRGFDVIHYHNISLVGGPKILEMGEGVKFLTAHEYWLVCPMNVLFRYDGVACTEKRCLRCTLHYRRPPQWWRYSNLLIKSARALDMVFHPSEFSHRKHQELGFDPPAMVLPYFHNSTSPQAIRSPASDSKPFFLCAARLEPLKGLHTIIPFFRTYSRARLVIAGQGDQRPELERLAAGSPNIEFAGWCPRERMAELYQTAAAIIIPTLCYETGPLAAVEALAHKLPIVGREIGTLPALLQETGAGITFTDNSSLGTALNRILDDGAYRHDLGERAFASYQRIFSVEAHLARYFGCIEEIQAKKAARAR